MKKLFFALAALVVSFAATAQNAEEIYKAFAEKTGVAKFVAARDGRSSLVEAEISAGPMVMNCKVTAKYPSLFRVEMDAQGQNVLFIIRDTISYVTVGTETQVITGKDNIREAMPIIDAAKDIVPEIDLTKNELKFIRTEGKGKKALHVIECIEKEKSGTIDETMLYFNAENGLLEKSIVKVTPKDGKQIEIEQTFKNYTSFDEGNLFLPSTVTTQMPQATIGITLKSFELDFPTANWMFAAPKKQ